MKKYFLAVLIISVCGFGFSSCEAENTAETESLYEYESSIDKKRVRTVKTGKRDGEEDSND